MHENELQSFIFKFNELWKAGITAHLDLDTHAGQAWVGLRVQLGKVHQYHPFKQQRPHRSPAYFCRQKRRQAARATEEVTTEGLKEAEKATTHMQKVGNAEEATKENATENYSSVQSSEDMTADQADGIVNNDVSEATVIEEIQATAEQVDSFGCEICDFESKWENGLNIHMSKKHPMITQLDGCHDVDELGIDEKYSRSEHYWREGWLGITYSVYLDAIAVIESCDDIPEEEKGAEKNKLLEARKRAFGENYKHFPPWKKN